MERGAEEAPAARPPAGRERLARSVERVAWLALALALLSVLAQRVWPFELFTHYWPQMGAFLAASGVVHALRGGRVAGAVHFAAALGLGGLVAPYLAWGPEPERVVGEELVTLFANVAREEDATERFVERVREGEPDVIGLVEVDAAFLDGLGALADAYPHRVLHPRDDAFGVALLSRLPLASGSVEPMGASGLPTIFAEVDGAGGRWRVVVAHPVPPFTPTRFHMRNDQLSAIAEAVSRSGLPTVLVADLNATPWSPFARDFVRDGSLVPATSGARSLHTWPDGIPFLALSLDRCLHTGGVGRAGQHVLGSVGSDHFPVLCRFSGATGGTAGATRPTGADPGIGSMVPGVEGPGS